MLPFTIDQFFGVFTAYNVAVWPAQVAAYGVAALALWGIATKRPWGGRVAASVLAIFWLWNGIAYHLHFFSAINPAAYLFGAAFILQGLCSWPMALSPTDWRCDFGAAGTGH